MKLRDPFGRDIDYLRISLTDRCNFRCHYCYPASGLRLVPRSRLLPHETIVRVARAALSLGVRKIKLTGGEPLLFADIVPLVRALSESSGLSDLAMTTNGSRLQARAGDLHRAGLRRLNLSLDSLDPARFRRITGGRGSLFGVLRGFREARRLGMKIKVNMVAMRGVNHDELDRFVAFSAKERVEVRFIEFMPLGGGTWDKRTFLGTEEMLEGLRERHTLTPLESDGVARRFATDTGARIGFIASMSEPFCDGCRRLRLTAWGTLRPCLFSKQETDLRPILASGASEAEIQSALVRAVASKPARNPVLFGEGRPEDLHIRSIGG